VDVQTRCALTDGCPHATITPDGSNGRQTVAWRYLRGTTTPPATGVTAATLSFATPTTPGGYEFRFFADNGFVRLAS
jgi:hypothetical protein